MSDVDAVRRAFRARDSDAAYRRRHAGAAHERALATRADAVEDVLRDWAGGAPSGLRLADLGCGAGDGLRSVPAAWCALRVGLDVVPERLARLASDAPGVRALVADAAAPALRPGAFDVALLFTVLSSLPDADARGPVLRAALDLLRPGGLLLVYDYRRYPGRSRGLRPGEVAERLPGHDVRSTRVTLAPPLSRALAGRADGVAAALERVPLLRTHDLIRVTA